MKRSSPTSALEKVEAILANPAIYALAEAVPAPTSAGRPRSYPAYMLIVYDCLLRSTEAQDRRRPNSPIP